MPTTDNYRVGHGETFKKESLRCPQCKAFVNKEDGECWACGCTLAEPSFDESEGYFLDNKEEL
jgi:predicted amidophosphoribosyltransferase